MMIQSYSGDAWGRRRLRDWNRMPWLMRALFVSVDSSLAHHAWTLIQVLSPLGFIAILVIVHNPFDGIASEWSDIAVLTVAWLSILAAEFVLRSVAISWYEGWRDVE